LKKRIILNYSIFLDEIFAGIDFLKIIELEKDVLVLRVHRILEKHLSIKIISIRKIENDSLLFYVFFHILSGKSCNRLLLDVKIWALNLIFPPNIN